MTIARLIEEYTSGARELAAYHKSLDRSDPLVREQSATVSGMLGDMRYAIDWMRRGRRPGNRRGAERADVYRQREMLSEAQGLAVSDADRESLVQTLLSLSERERACFLLHMAHGLTQEQIASILKVSRSSVRKFLDRAKRKVQRSLAG